MLLLLAKTPYSNSSIWFERKLLKKGKLHAQTFQLYSKTVSKSEKLLGVTKFSELTKLANEEVHPIIHCEVCEEGLFLNHWKNNNLNFFIYLNIFSIVCPKSTFGSKLTNSLRKQKHELSTRT